MNICDKNVNYNFFFTEQVSTILREQHGLTHLQSDQFRDVMLRPHKHQHRKGSKKVKAKQKKDKDLEASDEKEAPGKSSKLNF